MSDQQPALPPGWQLAKPPRTHRSRRWIIAFATVGLLLALSSVGLTVYQRRHAAAPATPEDVVRTFLAAVFLTDDVTRLDGVVCASWDPAEALKRTAAEVDPTAHVTWDSVAVFSTKPDTATVEANLAITLPGDAAPSSHQLWRFAVVDESGWRVCEARPLVSS